jgi:HEPN domain-containing protein
MPDKDVSKFLRAAKQRFDVADFLCQKTSYYLESIYLAGYTIECAFKALILAQIPKQKRETFHKIYFRGGDAHRYDVLKGWLQKKCKIQLPLKITEAIQKASWSVDLRYETLQKNYDDADEFLNAAKTILNWVEGVLKCPPSPRKKIEKQKKSRK